MADDYSPKKKYSPVIFVILSLFLIIVIFVVANLSAGKTTFFGKAAPQGVFNATNSYVFASPLTARVGGDKIRVTVFALDGQGRGVPNRNVAVGCKDLAVCQNASMVIEQVQSATDNLGQAIFDLSVPVAGKYEMEAVVEGSSIPQTVTVAFQ